MAWTGQEVTITQRPPLLAARRSPLLIHTHSDGLFYGLNPGSAKESIVSTEEHHGFHQLSQ
jgi:hypothetical protein